MGSKVQGLDALPPSIPRPKEYGMPQTVQMIATECPYTAHGLSVIIAEWVTCFVRLTVFRVFRAD